MEPSSAPNPAAAVRVEVRDADPDLQRWMDEATGLLDAGHVPPAHPVTAEQVYRALREALPDQDVGPGLPLPAPDLNVDWRAGDAGPAGPTGQVPDVDDLALQPDVATSPTTAPGPHDHGPARHSYGTSLVHRVAHACGFRHR